MPPRREDTYCRGGSLLGLLHSKRFHDLPHQGCFRIFPPDEEKVDHRVEVLNFKSTRGFDVQVFVEMRKRSVQMAAPCLPRGKAPPNRVLSLMTR